MRERGLICHMPDREEPNARGLFGGVFARGGVEADDTAWLQAMLDTEAGLARALERAGLAPAGAGEAVTTAARAENFDPNELGGLAALTGNPVPGLARALARQVPQSAAGAVHRGATSQDIVDTAAMLLAKRAIGAMQADLARAAGAAAGLAETHRASIMIGRTLLQQAVPVTFGLVAAGWLTGVDAAREGLAAVGGTLGSGIVLPLGDGTCPLGEVSRIASYLAGESAGQCGPCKLGLPSIARALAALIDGSGGIEALDVARRSAAGVAGRGACSHPDGVTRFVLSALDVFTEDLAAHVFHSSCGRPVRGVLPLPTGPEQEAQQRLVVDWTRCHGHGLCAHLVPELIHADAQGYPVILNIPVPAWLEKDAQQAVHMCPALALRLTSADPTPTRTDPVAIPAPSLRTGLVGGASSNRKQITAG
jgi:ferredoxin